MLFSKKIKTELISLHIPKTAGTSFRNILKNVYGDEEVVRFDINVNGVVRLNEELYDSRKLPEVKAIHGHFYIGMLESLFELPENYKLITWVRDPVKRVISNYYYLESRLREILNEEKKILNILSKLQRTLIEFARAEINRNRQTKFLSGRDPEEFDFVGIVEHFDAEIPRLASVMGWKDIPASIYHNKTPEIKPEISTDILEEIAKLNAEDIKLYQKAVLVRNNKINN
jgi:hypothetical protein